MWDFQPREKHGRRPTAPFKPVWPKTELECNDELTYTILACLAPSWQPCTLVKNHRPHFGQPKKVLSKGACILVYIRWAT